MQNNSEKSKKNPQNKIYLHYIYHCRHLKDQSTKVCAKFTQI